MEKSPTKVYRYAIRCYNYDPKKVELDIAKYLEIYPKLQIEFAPTTNASLKVLKNIFEKYRNTCCYIFNDYGCYHYLRKKDAHVIIMGRIFNRTSLLYPNSCRYPHGYWNSFESVLSQVGEELLVHPYFDRNLQSYMNWSNLYGIDLELPQLINISKNKSPMHIYVDPESTYMSYNGNCPYHENTCMECKLEDIGQFSFFLGDKGVGTESVFYYKKKCLFLKNSFDLNLKKSDQAIPFSKIMYVN